MKVKVRAIYGEHERVFEVACGSGDNKTIKWLTNVVTQRFALACPNGALRHREHFRGNTEHVQHQAVEVCLANGQMPHPAAIISDFLRDGDELIVTLIHNLKIDPVSGNGKLSKWASVAFTSTTDENVDEGDEDVVDDDPRSDPAMRTQIQAKSSFMRVVLGSQILNQKKIKQCVETEWGQVALAMPRLSAADTRAFKETFQLYWGVIVENFQYFSPGGQMTLENFRQFIDEIGLFSMRDVGVITGRVFKRTCRATGTGNTLELSGFMVALLLCAQLRHNDTFEHDSDVRIPADAVNTIIAENMVTCAEKLSFSSILKGAFCSDPVLFGIRDYHDRMFAVFEKYASKSHTLPTSLKIEHMAECLCHAGLQRDNDVSQTQWLFREVRKGLINGRDPPRERSQHESKYIDDVMPEDELTFPEFVEITARAGYYKFYKRPDASGAEAENQEEPECTVASTMIQGVQAAVGTLQDAPTPATAYGGRK